MIAWLIGDALTCLAREHPGAYLEFRSVLGDRTLALLLDEERLGIEDGAVSEPRDPASVEIRTTAYALEAILNGRLAIVDALVTQELELRGRADDLICLSYAMTIFLQGAVRCASMPMLARRLAQHARGERDAATDKEPD